MEGLVRIVPLPLFVTNNPASLAVPIIRNRCKLILLRNTGQRRATSQAKQGIQTMLNLSFLDLVKAYLKSYRSINQL